MGRKVQDIFAYYGPWQPKRPLPSTTCSSTKTRPFPIPWLALVNFEPNISRIYTPQLKSWVSILRSKPMKMERIVSSETSALKAQTPGDYPKDTIRHSTTAKVWNQEKRYSFNVILQNSKTLYHTKISSTNFSCLHCRRICINISR